MHVRRLLKMERRENITILFSESKHVCTVQQAAVHTNTHVTNSNSDQNILHFIQFNIQDAPVYQCTHICVRSEFFEREEKSRTKMSNVSGKKRAQEMLQTCFQETGKNSK